MNEELEAALARLADARRRFEAADPADGLGVDAAIHEVCMAEYEVRRVLLRVREGAA